MKDKLELNYYDSEDRTSKKGSIDLERCMSIRMEADDTNTSSSVCHLLNNQQPFKYIFSLKTKHRSRDRVYFLGSESLENVDAWMQCLRTVLYKKSHSHPSDEDSQLFTNSFKRPRSSDGHKHKHFSSRDHSSLRCTSFHGPKSHKKTDNNNSMDNLNLKNAKSQQNLSSQKQQKHTKKPPQHHQQQLEQQQPYDHSSQFDYIVSVKDNSFQDNLNESYVLLDQCFSGFKNKNDQNIINNNNNKPNDNYYNPSSAPINKYYNTASDDNIFMSSKCNNPRIKIKQPTLSNNINTNNNNAGNKNQYFVDSRSCNNLQTNHKQHYSNSEDYLDYVNPINNNNNNNNSFQIETNLKYKPPTGDCNNLHHNNNNNKNNNTNKMKIYNSGCQSQVLGRKSTQHLKTTAHKQHSSKAPHNYNSMVVFNNNNDPQINNYNRGSKNRLGGRRDGGGGSGFYTLPPKANLKDRSYDNHSGWYQKQHRTTLCVSDNSGDSNDEEEEDDDDYDYDEDSSPFTEVWLSIRSIC